MSTKKSSKKSSGGKSRNLSSFMSSSQSISPPVSTTPKTPQLEKEIKKKLEIAKKTSQTEEEPKKIPDSIAIPPKETKSTLSAIEKPDMSQQAKKTKPKTSATASQKDISAYDSEAPQKLSTPSSEKVNFLSQKVYFSPPTNPIGDSAWISKYPRNKDAREPQDSWHLRILRETNQLVQNMEQGVLLTVEYDGVQNKAFAKFYDLSDHSIKIWLDNTDHHPYCFHKTPIQELEQDQDLMQNLEDVGYTNSETVSKIDLLQDQTIQVTKLYGKTPTSIGGTRGMRDVLGGAWEAQIRYHHNYIYDRNLIPGMYYTIKNGKIAPIYPGMDARLEQDLLKVFETAPPEVQEIAKVYHPVFSTPIPSLRRVAFDIEVEEPAKGGLPNPLTAEYPVISVAFASNDGLRRVYCLDRPEIPLGTVPPEFPTNTEVFFFREEKRLIEETFRLFWQYPLVLSFNGDNFDNTYLSHRATNLRIPAEINPIVIERGSGMISQRTDFKHTIHIDLYQFFANRSIKGYAFGGVYMRNSLDDIASSLLGVGKVKHEGILIGKMTIGDMIHYNLNDAIITLNLTTFNDQVMWNLLIILLRITKLPLQDLVRLQISAWIRSLMFYEHRRKNILIPRMKELEERGEFKQDEDTTFEGAYVVDPTPGIHYNVAVLDFSSLYPSIIMTRNLSYETVKCIHPECRMNLLPNTKYWACTKKMGLFAYVVGFLREVRVKWFKPISSNKSLPKSQRQTASVMSSALKVFINGAYGVFGSSNFPLYYLPVAESTTAIGRYSILNTIDQAKSMGITVLYGDSDSVFLLNPTHEQIQNLIAWAEKTLDLDLELDKTYQFLALSERKKNYIGVRMGGEEVDLKGLLAKKQNTPEFIKIKFQEVQDILTQITDPSSFKANRDKIIKIIRQSIKLIGVPSDQGGFKLEDYGITVALHRDIDKYIKSTPQHIKALKQLPRSEQEKVEQGEYITFIKTRSEEGVKPLDLASLSDIDDKKYKELLRSTFEQVLDALGISYDEIQGQKKLHDFFQK